MAKGKTRTKGVRTPFFTKAKNIPAPAEVRDLGMVEVKTAPVEVRDVGPAVSIDTIKGSLLQAHESIIARGLRSFVEVGNALATIRDQQLYKASGFASFEAYCKERWQLGRSRAYQLIDASGVVSTIVDVTPPANEAQVRPLLKLADPQKRAEAWGEAVAIAAGKKVTARHVDEAVRRRLPRHGRRVMSMGRQGENEWSLVLAIGDFKDAVRRLAAKWPEKERRLIPEILRDIATELVGEVDGGSGELAEADEFVEVPLKTSFALRCAVGCGWTGKRGELSAHHRECAKLQADKSDYADQIRRELIRGRAKKGT